MWGTSDPDPGGDSVGPKGAQNQQEVSDLKDQAEQQLLLIAQLKEMLRKEQSNVSQEKVEEYVNTLNRARAKKSRQKKDESGTSETSKTVTSNIDSIKKDRINLLRQQLEENKARLAERGKSKKGIEKMVTEFQAQLNESQQFTSSLNLSTSEPKNIEYNENTSQKELYNILITKERKINELLARSQKLEGTVLDLQENVKEKDSVIDARTKAITLMTDSLSKKGKSTLDALEETKEQMRKMQENFVTLEGEMKARQLTLLNDLKTKNIEIGDLQETNKQLQSSLSQINSRKDEGQVSTEEINRLKTNNEQLLEKITILKKEIKSTKALQETSAPEQNIHEEQEKSKAQNAELYAKINDLEKIIETLKTVHSKDNLLDELETTKVYNQNLLQKIDDLEKEHEQHLLDDLEVKNRLEGSYKEIADILSSVQNELEETKAKLKDYETKKESEIPGSNTNKEIERLTKEKSELDKQLQDALADLNLLKNTGMNTKRKQEDIKEIEKLKKQLDESNKSMIKMRAQQKGKIKELNKKLEQFKKMNDANALIAQLQNENLKLSEKVAILEEEKGNMQLKMVESSGSLKDSFYEEQVKNLEDNLVKIQNELADKDKVVEILELELINAKQQLKDEEMSTQVSSEMSSIQFEEQLEKIEAEKKQLQANLEVLDKEKNDLLESIENLTKEKQELNTKLENYIQENMELIDKLEKLSAEKVSSAESIEMVEGLTQQEKLELAAYQKIIGHEEVGKCTEDDHMEHPAELNESVLQLSEDTAELLQKIEMFTRERKEVMQKMDNLKEENNTLNAKVKEMENNRDILAETYEQLQNENEVILNEKEELLTKLKLTSDGSSTLDTEESAEVLRLKLKEVQVQYEELLNNNNQLKSSLKELDLRNQEKYNLEEELKTSRQLNNDLETKLNNHIEEINNYQLTIEENKNELINSSQIISHLQDKLQDREKDVEELSTSINELNKVISELQAKNSSYEVMETELERLKSELTTQMEQAQEYEAELNQNSEVIRSLNNELAEMNKKILESQNELEVKDYEIGKLQKEIQNKEKMIQNLQSAIEDKDKSFKTLSEEIKTKYLDLQQQLNSNTGSLHKQVEELQLKNKEQLEKMKKLAAHLKKKTQGYQELEKQYNDDKEKWESHLKENETTVAKYQGQIEVILKELEETKSYLHIVTSQKDEEIKLFVDQIRDLEQINVDQQNYIINLKHKEEKLNEVNLQKEMSESLHEEINNENVSQQLIQEEKIRELEMMLETKQYEMQHYIERVGHLEEALRLTNEEKSGLSSTNLELEEKLSLTSHSFKEKALLEDQLELRLAEVTANDEILTKKLQETAREHEELLKKQNESEELIKKLKIKLRKSHDKVNELKANQATNEELERTNTELKKQLATLEANYRHIQAENESLQQRSLSDYEKIEADYQIQLEELLKAKNDLTVECEKLQETIKEFEGKEDEFLMEIEEYKLRLQENDVSTEEVNRLTNELEAVNGKLHEASSEVSQLSQEISLLMDEINALKAAKESVMEVVKEAVEQVSQKVDSFVQTEITQELSHNNISSDAHDVQWLNQPSEFDKSATFEVATNITQPQNIQDYFSNNANSNMQQIFEPLAQAQNVDNLKQFEKTIDKIKTDDTAHIDDSQEALIQKIKALEFLLFNADQENAVLAQCAEMATELADMIYEKANIPSQRATQHSSDLDSQILSNADLDTLSRKQELEPLEYQPVTITQGEQSQPVQENIIAPQKAYLCYDNNENKDVLNLESQIMSHEDINAMAANKLELQNIEYQHADASLGPQQHPVVEPLSRPQQAYLCYAKDDKQHSLEAFEENDDGWGWGPEEGRLEEEHMSSVEHIPQVRNMQLEIQGLKENIKVLQVEREHHLEEIKQLQIKSGKLVKKCRELKLKSEQASAGPSSSKQDDGGFFDLNETIQEELKQQVQKLEKKLKDIHSELEKERGEKSNLLKKVDVLASANDRMVEMKEIQDAEVHRWQRKCQEVQEKLVQYEWDSDDFGGSKKETGPSTSNVDLDDVKVQELEQVIRDLTLDNEELQSLLEEQRNLRLKANKKKEVLPEKEIDNSVDLQKQIKEQAGLLSQVTQEVENLHLQKDSIDKEMNTLRQTLQAKEEAILQLQENKQFEAIQANQSQADLKKQLVEKDEDINQLSVSLTEVTNLKIELENQVELLNEELVNKNKLIDKHRQQVDENVGVKEQLRQLEVTIEEKEDTIRELNKLITDLRNEQSQWDSIEYQLKSMITQKDKNIDELLAEKHQKEFENSVLQSEEHLNSVDQLNKKNTELNKKDKEIEQLLNQVALNESLAEKLRIKEQEIEELTKSLSEKNKEFELRVTQWEQANQESAIESVAMVDKLNASWQIQVDQRGEEVAELWKNHLKSVENEFAATQQKLLFDISELEERCNILLNENNELRKNVNLEISNEVDKLTALHQQIANNQQAIAAMQASLEEKQNENKDLNQQIANNEQTINALQIALQEKQVEIDELRNNSNNAASLEQELHQQIVNGQQTIASLQITLQEKQCELEELRNNSNNPISLEHDLHQEIRNNKETIASLQMALREKQNELEELRNNAHNAAYLDQDLNQQVVNNQQTISSLQMALQDKQNEVDELRNSVTNEASLKQELESTKAELTEKNNKIASMEVVVDTTQEQFEEKRQVVDEIVYVLQKNLATPLSYDKQDILNEFNRQMTSVQEKNAEILELGQSIQKLQAQLTDITGQKNREITGLNHVIEDFEKELSIVHEKDAEIIKLTSLVDQVTFERDGLAQELQKIQRDHSNCQTVLSNNIQRFEQLQTTCNTLEERLKEKENTIEELNTQLRQVSETTANDSNKEIERLCSELYQSKQEYSDLYQHLTESQNQVQELSANLAQKIQDYETVSQQLNYYQETIAIKDEEISRLQSSLQEKEVEYSTALTNIQQTQYNDVQNYYEQQLSAKDYENHTLRAQLQELESTNGQLNAKLEEEGTMKREIEERLDEQTKLVDEDTKQMEELKLIIEDQVVRIEELKKELFEKSGQYDSIIAEMDMGRPGPVTTQPMAPSQAEKPQNYTEDDLSEPVNRAELDIALYMLHQRDVRCEELTAELRQLLEERDTLQLRLSNAIREKEELRKMGPDFSLTTVDSGPISASDISPTTHPAGHPSQAASGLATKLSELKIVGYKKDKTLVDEQDARHMQQLAIMQQHIKEASKLPPEAAAKLVNASYTLSRDVQSPSKVLLNWLWGNSTPKAGES